MHWTTIPDGQLRLSDVPEEGADWEAITRFSLTVDGYELSFRRWYDTSGWEVKTAFAAGVAKLGALSLTELRICLFREQRYLKRRFEEYYSEPPGDKPDLRYAHALICAIRARFSSKESADAITDVT